MAIFGKNSIVNFFDRICCTRYLMDGWHSVHHRPKWLSCTNQKLGVHNRGSEFVRLPLYEWIECWIIMRFLYCIFRDGIVFTVCFSLRSQGHAVMCWRIITRTRILENTYNYYYYVHSSVGRPPSLKKPISKVGTKKVSNNYWTIFVCWGRRLLVWMIRCFPQGNLWFTV